MDTNQVKGVVHMYQMSGKEVQLDGVTETPPSWSTILSDLIIRVVRTKDSDSYMKT